MRVRKGKKLTIDASREASVGLENTRNRYKLLLPNSGVFLSLLHYGSHIRAFSGRLLDRLPGCTMISSFFRINRMGDLLPAFVPEFRRARF